MILRLSNIRILPPKLLLPLTLRRVRHHLKEVIDGMPIWILEYSRQLWKFEFDLFTWSGTQKFSFREVLVFHIPSMTSGSSVAQAWFIKVGTPGIGGDLMLVTGWIHTIGVCQPYSRRVKEARNPPKVSTVLSGNRHRMIIILFSQPINARSEVGRRLTSRQDAKNRSLFPDGALETDKFSKSFL